MINLNGDSLTLLLRFIKDYDHWVAFFILIFVGAKMIFESFKNDCENKINADKFITLLFLSKIFKKGAEILGGLILVSIGIKILLEHIL